jgi:signal transduction histidine kinase
LQTKNAELTRFTNAVSHDLKSPLVTIITFLGYLEEGIRNQNTARIKMDMGYIRSAAEKMATLLDELQELSRIGRMMHDPVETPLQEIVREALALVAGRIAEKGVRVIVTEDPVILFGDRSRLVEVFQNLIDNAVKFTGDQAAPRIEIGAEKSGDEIVLLVRDNGMGIDPQHQEKIFGLFEKLDPRTDGTGMGLALVKRIVEVHGGRIWVDSQGPGLGTCFRFTLPGTKYVMASI